MATLEPPKTPTEDPGAHELVESSEDDFDSASEGKGSAPHSHASSGSISTAVPITRVERVDDSPAHGEVPGTDAYRVRALDAVPDEVEVVPEGQISRSRSGSLMNPLNTDAATRSRSASGSASPGGSPIPKTVVEKVDPDTPAHGDVPGTVAFENRLADAQPDEVRQAPLEVPGEGLRTGISENFDAPFLTPMGIRHTGHDRLSDENDDDDHDDDDDDDEGGTKGGGGGGGDDFDDFEEGGDDEDFGDFDDGGEAFEPSAPSPASHAQDAVAPAQSSLPLFDISSHSASRSALLDACQPYIHAILPSTATLAHQETDPLPDSADIFTSDRSRALWTQLIEPPPLQLPNWTKSRIRRLFLVSLGVPVDLDEILPASKQKKLVLPSVRASEDERRTGGNTKGSRGSKDGDTKETTGRKKENEEPGFDANAVALLCKTTAEKLAGMTDEELEEHLNLLQRFEKQARSLVEFWQKKLKSTQGEKEAFEGVIENLVRHAKRVRK